MKIISEKASIQAPINVVFEFLSQAHNIECLLPQDKISDFQSDEKGCTFKVQGGFLISLLYVDKEIPTLINMKSGEKAPFTYTLAIHLSGEGEQTSGYIEFVGDVNMFLKMMVEKPLIGLFNYMSNKLQEQF
jgi:carbon monoxide dehydrogenase subunit G